MITREFLEKHLSDGPRLYDVARRASGCAIHWGDHEQSMLEGLEWMARFTENNRHPQPPWKTPQEFETVWPIKMRGLAYKSSMDYLTAQGWPSGHGKQCWYVCIECGFREYIGATEPVCATLRAVIVIAVTQKWQDIHPRERPNLMQMISDEYTR